ncbi:transposase [Lachnotalea glycerini]|uniref:Transposase n=1 Tax=Lachnotalea glycerini TaxID=1763509 RepID=A0A318ELW7_9FIRM|nr:transposase [Lachnotalea glycerini]
MIYAGIDVAKDKHDCFITNSDGEVLFNSFTIQNNRDGFDEFYQKLESVTDDLTKVKVGLEATGHYSYNILGYLLDKGLTTFVINPLLTNLYRKSLSLRKTKTDKVDAHMIATMLMSDVNLKSYSDTSYHIEELKSLTRYRFDKVKERAALKQSISRLVCILFPELEKLVPTLHMNSIYELLAEFPSSKAVSGAHLTKLTNILAKASKGRYGKDTAITFREAARVSIGSNMPAKSLELKHTIKLIRELDSEIGEIEKEIKIIMDKINSPILSIPGISYRMGAMIIAKLVILIVLILQTKSWHMPDCPPPLINQASLMVPIPIWRNVALGIFATPYSIPQNLYVFGIQPLGLILPKREQKVNIIT